MPNGRAAADRGSPVGGWSPGQWAARLTSPQLSARERRALTIIWSIGSFLYAITIALAAIDPGLSIAG